MFLSTIRDKFDIIQILFYPEDFTNKGLLLYSFFFNILFNYFMNALLYTDDIV